MSIKIIEEQIFRFLKSDTPEVIAIRGAWGVGKTYAWKTYLKEAQKKNEIALDKYAYVSLFGVNSLEALKFTLFSEKDDINRNPREMKNIKKNKKAMPIAQDVAKIFRMGDLASRAIAAIAIVEKTIICLDDFERMSLNAQEVLGLISELKEQKSCKIVLIFNDEGLSKKANKKYNTYKEKVIDKEFEFLPTAEECAEIVFSNNDEKYSEKLKEKCCKLGIKNIRILKKIERLAEDLTPFLENKEEETRHKVLSSLVLFTYAMYKKSDNFPDFDFVKNGRRAFMKSYSMQKVLDSQGQRLETPEEKKKLNWANRLEDYGYRDADDLDVEIANSVERGYFIEENITKEIKKYNDNIIINNKDKSHTEAWNLYHYSFDDNSEEVVEKMYEAVKNHEKHISQLNLSSSLELLRDLGADKKADELIELVISSRVDDDYFNIKDYTFRGRVNDQKMRDRFEQEYNKRNPPKTQKEVLNHLISNNGWSNKDVEILSALSDEEYYKLFKNEKSIDCHYWIKVCLKFGYAGNTEKEKLIVTNVVAALKKIGSESKLNKRRIEESYGIEVDEIAPKP
jgi:hypothetical protein